VSVSFFPSVLSPVLAPLRYGVLLNVFHKYLIYLTISSLSLKLVLCPWEMSIIYAKMIVNKNNKLQTIESHFRLKKGQKLGHERYVLVIV
jgi:hypothetical protein